MSNGFLRLHTFAANDALPLGFVDIEVYTSDETMTLRSNEWGITEEVTLFAPPKVLSLTPNVDRLPYALYNIRLRARGYMPMEIRNVPIFDGELTVQPVNMIPTPLGLLVTDPIEAIVIIIVPPSALLENAVRVPDLPSLPIENRNAPAPANIPTFAESPSIPTILREVVIPETIRVHLGRPQSSAQNVYVGFIDYIKNVACSEIYSTWPTEALNANIIAQVSFALNRVYTEYYPSRGYDFDITNNTAFDQAFVNGRPIFERISRLVDEIFNLYIERDGQNFPLNALYCNGTTVTCNGLSQWGTVDLARKGYTTPQIIHYYYGDVTIKISTIVGGNTISYPGYPLRMGDQGEDVSFIQGQLNAISKNFPIIPKINPIDGIFGVNTRKAVIAFQKQFDLNPDGIVGKSTWYKISTIYVAVRKLAELDAIGNTIDIPVLPPKEFIGPGDVGSAVRYVQYLVSLLSAYYTTIPDVTIDGVYGADTTNSVLQVQKEFGLKQTGTVNAETWNLLYRAYYGIQKVSN